MSPGGTAENGANNSPKFLSPRRGLIGFWNANPQLKLRAIFCRLCEAEKSQRDSDWPAQGGRDAAAAGVVFS
jgi:hypothetical protein